MADVRISMKNFQEHLKQTREQIQITHPLLKLTSTEFLVSLIVENISSYDLIYKESHLNLLVKGGSLHSMMTSTLEGTYELPSKSAGGLFLKGRKYIYYSYSI